VIANRADRETVYNRFTAPDRRCEECQSPIIHEGLHRFVIVSLDEYRLLYLFCKHCGATDFPNIRKDAQRIREHLIAQSAANLLMTPKTVVQ
jgi:RNase P subunit RPR2